MKVKKRSGRLANLDISNIQKQTKDATFGLDGVSQSELEVDAQLVFIDGMTTTEIQETLIKTAVDKIDIDRPNWTYVASRLFLYNLYHSVNRNTKNVKNGEKRHLQNYIEVCQKYGKMLPNLQNGYDLDDLNNHMDHSRDFLFNYLGIKTLYDRYLIKDNNGNVIETPQEMFMGIAMFLAQEEANKQERAKEFYDVISQFEVMLATPTLSNARTNRHQLSSCYIGSTPDNIEGIFDSFKEQGLLSKFGGGIGWDWNNIRSQSSDIDGNVGAAGGPIPFLKIENDIAIAVDQLGTRKGAIAVYIEPWNISIEDFIDLKKNSGEERRRAHDLFPALFINDLFMQRVLDDAEWTLFDPRDVNLCEVYSDDFEKEYIALEKSNTNKKVIKAKDLWKKILTSYFETGSPFLTFKDTANKANPNSHTGKIRSSNLCTEIFQNTSADKYKVKAWLDDINFRLFDEEELVETDNGIKKGNKLTSLDTLSDGRKIYNIEKERIAGETAVCNLASINLSKINTKQDIERVTPIAIRMLDNVIDLNFYPLKKVKDTNLKNRAIGLGVMGEAQMLAEKHIHFGSIEHFNFIDNIMEMVSYNAILSSSNIAKEKSSYPQFEGSAWSKGIMPQDHVKEAVKHITTSIAVYDWDSLREKVKTNGMRNGYLMAIAPTSSISILVGTTQAIEPVYKRKWYEENLSGQIPVVAPNLSPETWEYYKPAYDVEQMDIIKAAAIRQKWIDQGQSTNIFMRLDKASGRYLHEIYTLAWQLGLKSTYYLRGQSPESNIEVADRSMECSGCQ